MLEDLFEKSRLFFLAGDLRGSREVLDKIQHELAALPDNPASRIMKFRYHNNLASVFQRKLDFPMARKHFREALEIISDVPRQRHDYLALVNNNLGLLETQVGNLEDAERFLNQAREHIDQIKDQKKRAEHSRVTSFNRARMLLKSHRLDEARDEVAHMNRIGKSGSSENGVFQARNFECSASLLAALAKESEASQSPEYIEFQNWSISHFHHARDLYEKLEDRFRAMRALLNALAVDLDAGRQSPELLESLEEVEGYAEEISSPLFSGLVIEKRVHFFLNAEDTQLALSETERCLDLLHEIPVPERLRILGRLKNHAVALGQKPLEKKLDKYIQTLAGGEGAEQQRLRG